MPDQILDAYSSDPVKLGWQQGLPPAPEQRIHWADAGHMRFPTHRYAFSNMRQFLPTARVARGNGPVWELPVALRDDLDAVPYQALDDGRALTWEQSLAENFTDGIVVLHRGTIVYERYLGVTRPDSTHIAFSITKSYVGTMAEMLVAEGKLDPAAPVAELIPELAGSKACRLRRSSGSTGPMPGTCGFQHTATLFQTCANFCPPFESPAGAGGYGTCRWRCAMIWTPCPIRRSTMAAP